MSERKLLQDLEPKKEIDNSDWEDPKATTGLFEIIKKMFSDKEWKLVSNSDKIRNAFMINRYALIQYPTIAALISKMSIAPNLIVDLWRKEWSKFYNTTPGWMYIKTKKVKDTKTIEDQIYNYDEKMLEYFKLINDIQDDKTFNEMIRRYPEEVLEDLNKYSSIARIEKKTVNYPRP